MATARLTVVDPEALRHPRVALAASPVLREPRLFVPPLRRGLISRPRLVNRLRSSEGALCVVVAPPGYGKTTLLAQWCAEDARPFGWVALEDRDNDPTSLLGAVLGAVEGLVGGAGPAAAGPPTVLRTGAVLAALGGPVVLVLDDIHVLHERVALDDVMELLHHLPAGSQLVLAGRRQPVTLARLRLEREVLELAADDLALVPEEVREVLAGAGAAADDAVVGAVLERTEGWPAAVYLAATAARRRGPGAVSGSEFSGDHRLVAEYLYAEVMDTLDDEVVAFLRRSAVLHRMSGALCDAVLGRSGSADLLERLTTANLLVVPLDAGRTWYRYHAMLRELLLAEAERQDPDVVRDVRAAAATWHQTNGDPLDALEYAWEAGDDARAAYLVGRLGQPLWAAGKGATAERWLERLEARGIVAEHPELEAMWAYLLALGGRAVEAERWGERAFAGSFDGAMPDGSPTFESWQVLVRAVLCREGPDQMLADARRATQLLAVSSPMQCSALILLGLACSMAGDAERAREAMEDAVEMGERTGARVAHTVALAELALFATAEGAWAEASDLVDRALALVEAAGLQTYGTSAVVYAAQARLAEHRGDTAARRTAIARFTALRPQLSWAMPYIAVQTHLVLGAVHLAAGDFDAARTLVDEARRVVRRRPALGSLVDELVALEGRVRNVRGGSSRATTMTVAELRLLPLLPTHLSFRGIGERLYLSPHTIKSQAMSIYRKLNVSSRAEAVACARELGLIAD